MLSHRVAYGSFDLEVRIEESTIAVVVTDKSSARYTKILPMIHLDEFDTIKHITSNPDEAAVTTKNCIYIIPIDRCTDSNVVSLTIKVDELSDRVDDLHAKLDDLDDKLDDLSAKMNKPQYSQHTWRGRYDFKLDKLILNIGYPINFNHISGNLFIGYTPGITKIEHSLCGKVFYSANIKNNYLDKQIQAQYVRFWRGDCTPVVIDTANVHFKCLPMPALAK